MNTDRRYSIEVQDVRNASTANLVEWVRNLDRYTFSTQALLKQELSDRFDAEYSSRVH